MNALDATGLAIFRCERPLSGTRRDLGPAKHEYICVQQGDHIICNGHTAKNSENPILGPGRPTNDKDGGGPDQLSVERCTKVRDDDTCLESCVGSRLESRDRPGYGILSYNCQTWVKHVSTNVPLIANDKRFANLVARLLIFLGGSLLGQAWFPLLGLCDGTALGAACLFGGVLTMSSLLIRPGQSNWPDRLGEAFFTCLLWYIPVGLGISAASAVFVLGLQTNPQGESGILVLSLGMYLPVFALPALCGLGILRARTEQ